VYICRGLKTMLCVAIAALRRCSERITSVEQAMSLNGVGEKTALKVMMAVVILARLTYLDLINRSWKSSKPVPYGASTPREPKMSRLSSYFREYMALVGDIRFPLDSPSSFTLPGQSTAYAWYLAGCRTLDDIEKRKGGIELSRVQVIGLKYYDGTLSHAIWCMALIDVKQI
jgi:DNA polymerase lambda